MFAFGLRRIRNVELRLADIIVRMARYCTPPEALTSYEQDPAVTALVSVV
jgi:hypothetical protein